jgi:hypothetical protein
MSDGEKVSPKEGEDFLGTCQSRDEANGNEKRKNYRKGSGCLANARVKLITIF